MAVLRKVKASTLMETLVATVLLIVIFTVASLTLNSFFGNTVTSDTRAVNSHLNELEYRYQNRRLQLPYAEIYQDWNISISADNQYNIALVKLEATHPETQKVIVKTIIAHVETP